MRNRRTTENRAGVATTEYIIVLLAIVVILVTVVTGFGGTVKALWANTLDGSLTELSAAGHAVGDMDDSAAPCPYSYSPATGRWHDPANSYGFVTFEEAAAANCS
jgi:Flp pilus assembly pilin Flp